MGIYEIICMYKMYVHIVNMCVHILSAYVFFSHTHTPHTLGQIGATRVNLLAIL